MENDSFWRGEFGDEYTQRNRVDWRARIPFWKEIIDLTGARSVYEIGCNAGWNLSAIKRAYPDVTCRGEDVNEGAIHQAKSTSIDDAWLSGLKASQYSPVYDLAFTAGVLIHINSRDLREMMLRVINGSADYVLAVEYASDKEEEVEYRGHSGKLWRRPYGHLYQDMGLKLVMEAGAGPGFDDCTAWLLRK